MNASTVGVCDCVRNVLLSLIKRFICADSSSRIHTLTDMSTRHSFVRHQFRHVNVRHDLCDPCSIAFACVERRENATSYPKEFRVADAFVSAHNNLKWSGFSSPFLRNQNVALQWLLPPIHGIGGSHFQHTHAHTWSARMAMEAKKSRKNVFFSLACDIVNCSIVYNSARRSRIICMYVYSVLTLHKFTSTNHVFHYYCRSCVCVFVCVRHCWLAAVVVVGDGVGSGRFCCQMPQI